MKLVRIICASALGFCLAGCEVGPNYHAPSTTMPSGFTQAPPATEPTTVAATTQPVDLTQWWKSLNDPELNALVESAIQSNPRLEIALTRLQEARATEAIITGTSLPQAGLSAGAGRGTGTNSTKGRVSAPLNAATDTQGLREITQVIGFDAGWELDLFGKYRRAIEAADDDTQAAMEVRNAVLITLISDVARAYVNLRSLELRLSIAQESVKTAQQTYDLVEARFSRGLSNELDTALASRQLGTVRAQIAPLTAGVAMAKRRIAVLLGQFPEQEAAELSQPAALPKPPDAIEAGLPIDLLRRRPDIREIERELAASTARVGVATANLFPRVGVTAGVGLQGQGLGREPQSSMVIWSAGPTAYWPILDFGTLRGLIDVQDLHTHELAVSYQRTILHAVEEVDNSINDFTAEQEHLRELSNALDASQRAMTLASERYDRGLTDFLNVLDAQRQLYGLQDQQASAEEAVVTQYIALYKALGGGWETYPSIPPLAHAPIKIGS